MDKKQDGARFAEMMTSIAEMYSKTMSEFTLDMWFSDLKAYSIAQVWRAFQAHRKDPKQGQFMPKPADIVRHIDGMPDEKAVFAWSRVYKAISRFGSWTSVQFDDHAIHQAIETMGGWAKLCSMTIDELPFKQREFEKLYTSALTHPATDVPKYLAGVAEISNNSQGLPSPKPVYLASANSPNDRLLGHNPSAIVIDDPAMKQIGN